MSDNHQVDQSSVFLGEQGQTNESQCLPTFQSPSPNGHSMSRVGEVHLEDPTNQSSHCSPPAQPTQFRHRLDEKNDFPFLHLKRIEGNDITDNKVLAETTFHNTMMTVKLTRETKGQASHNCV